MFDLGNFFRNHHNIHIWDSSDPLVEEYIRSCFILERKNSESFWEALDYSTPYINCYDNVHPGYLVLSQATQLLYNNIFNNWKTIYLMVTLFMYVPQANLFYNKRYETIAD